ncbi:hypothetical protein Tco_0368366 [Tanacetum coccineum]
MMRVGVCYYALLLLRLLGGGIRFVSEIAEVAAEDAALSQPKQKKKRKAVVVDSGEPSHPANKLRDNHGVSSGPTVGGKSQSATHRLLVGAVLNAEVRGETAPTLPFVISSVSATPEHKEGDHSDSLVGANLLTIGARQRFVISSDSSHHSGANIEEAEVDYVPRSSVLVMTAATAVTATTNVALVIREAVKKPSFFGAASSSAGGTEPTPAGFFGLAGTNLLVGDIRTVCREMADEFAPPRFFTSVRRIEHDQLFAEFNIGAARQMSLSAELRMRSEYTIREKRKLKAEAGATKAIRLHAEAFKFEAIEKSCCDELKLLKESNVALQEEKGLLDVKVADLAATVKVREQEAADSDAMVTIVKLQNNSLTDQVRGLEISAAGLQEKVTAYENFVNQLETFQDNKMKEVNEKLEKLDTNVVEYLSALGAAIGKAIEKGMQDGLSASIVHGTKGRTLTDIAAYNPSAEGDYRAALHHLQHVDFSLLAELKANKDASTKTVMNLLCLEDNLANRLDLTGSQPSKIKENLANHVSALRDVFVPLSEPLSAAALIGTEGTSTFIPALAGTATSLTVTLASASIIPPISTDDYGILHVDGQRNDGTDDNVDGNVDSFLNVDDVDLNHQ